MLPRVLLSSLRRSRRAFSLVEVALALGIAGFVLVGLIGAIPVASSVGRQSIEQTRAVSIAGTVFASLRAGRFGAESLLDDGSAPFDLNTLTSDTLTSTSNAKVFYAYFDEIITNNTTEERRLHFVATAPTGILSYEVSLRFDNKPAGTLAPYTGSAGSTHAQANAVEISIRAAAHPKDVYRFSSVVANRTD